MPEKTQLLIHNPCHEQWGDMQPNKVGRFCGSCRKTVVDLTMMSDQELLAWFAGGRRDVCGRATEDQLNRDLVPQPVPKKKGWALWWQFLLAGLLVSSKASSQTKPPKPPMSQVNKGDQVTQLMGYATMVPRCQMVTLIDSATQKPVPGASVQVDDDPKFFIGDSSGLVMIPYERIVHASVLKVSSIGYSHAVVPVEESWLGTPKVVKLVVQLAELQPVAVKAYGVTTRQFTVGGVMSAVVVRRTWVNSIKDTLLCRKSPLTVYPNPVSRGASVTLSLRMDKPGDYMAQLFSNDGRVVESMRLEGVEGPRTELMNIPGTLAAGTYFVRLFHMETGKLYTEKVVVL